MKKSNGIALFLMLIAYPIIILGVNTEAAWLWWTGLISLTAGALIPPVEKLTSSGES